MRLHIRWEVPPSRRLAFSAVLIVLAGSVAVTAGGDFRSGGYLLGLSAAMAAVFRAFLPEKYCLGLLVRTRWVDVLTSGSLALAVLVGVRLVPGP